MSDATRSNSRGTEKLKRIRIQLPESPPCSDEESEDPQSQPEQHQLRPPPNPDGLSPPRVIRVRRPYPLPSLKSKSGPMPPSSPAKSQKRRRLESQEEQALAPQSSSFHCEDSERGSSEESASEYELLTSAETPSSRKRRILRTRVRRKTPIIRIKDEDQAPFLRIPALSNSDLVNAAENPFQEAQSERNFSPSISTPHSSSHFRHTTPDTDSDVLDYSLGYHEPTGESSSLPAPFSRIVHFVDMQPYAEYCRKMATPRTQALPTNFVLSRSSPKKNQPSGDAGILEEDSSGDSKSLCLESAPAKESPPSRTPSELPVKKEDLPAILKTDDERGFTPGSHNASCAPAELSGSQFEAHEAKLGGISPQSGLIPESPTASQTPSRIQPELRKSSPFFADQRALSMNVDWEADPIEELPTAEPPAPPTPATTSRDKYVNMGLAMVQRMVKEYGVSAQMVEDVFAEVNEWGQTEAVLKEMKEASDAARVSARVRRLHMYSAAGE